MGKRSKKQKTSGFGKFLVLFIVIAIIGGAVFGYKVYENGGGMQGILLTLLGANAKNIDELDTIYVLLMGVSTDIDSQLTDTIILCGYNPKSNQATIISIPRDTFVGTNKYHAKGSEKINALYARGAESTVDAVENITGIDIDYYAVIKTEMLVEIVDLIGGVEFDVPINMEYDDETQNLHINLSAGLQVLDGDQAEQLVRFRHNNDGTTYSEEYGNNDYGRMHTQRDFIKATISQTFTWKNIFKINSIVKSVLKNIETDMIYEDVIAYLPYIINIDLDNMITRQLPGQSEYQNNVWIFVYNKAETTALMEEISNSLQ